MKLLHLDSSILGPHSVSRLLSAEIVARQVELHPGIEVQYRDLEADAALHLSAAHMAVFQGAPFEDPALGADLAVGGAYIDELLACDILVIGAPMYNFTVPSQLKAWIDRVLIAGRTFRYDERGAPVGLATGKKAFIASARGGLYADGGPAAALEHHESYLRGVLGFIGITDVTVVRAEGVRINAEAKAAAIDAARAEIAVLAA